MAENTLVWGAEKCGKNGRLVVMATSAWVMATLVWGAEKSVKSGWLVVVGYGISNNWFATAAL